MHRETSPTVSSIAAAFINFRPPNLIAIIDSGDPDQLAEFCADIRTLAGSALSQDETPIDQPVASADEPLARQGRSELQLDEPVETGGHDEDSGTRLRPKEEDRDGPIPFDG